MKFDVATLTSLWLITFLCCALITTALARMFATTAAFRFWAIAFYLLAASSACFALHFTWQHDLLMVASATLALQSRLLIWGGTRELFGATARWRAGLGVTAVFCVLYAAALKFDAPVVLRAMLLVAFFLPCRAGALYEVCRRRRAHLGGARLIAAIGASISTLNAIVPLTLALLDRIDLSLLLGNPQTTSAVYAVVFAGDLLLACGLLVLAFKRLSVERDMLAAIDRGASEHLARAREVRAQRGARRPLGWVAGHDFPGRPRSLPWTV
ncbi:hypothetical protein ABH945_005225 [Paraburkholderia sp. GAS333]|uniref:hypothetical protein n=1 Tax=Paraburkholderia sp. GAS333 TaxID=3156279 RepID=UPI003D1F509D